MKELTKIKTIIALKKVLDKHLIYSLPLNYYIGGSACLDFIDEPNNLNIIIVYRKDPANAMNESVINKIQSIAADNKFVITVVDQNNPSVFDWLYSHTYENIFGVDKYNLNLLEHENKIIDLIKQHYNNNVNNMKRMFDIIYYYFIVSNNSYEIYPYQKQILAKWHKGIYDEALLESVVNELHLKGE